MAAIVWRWVPSVRRTPVSSATGLWRSVLRDRPVLMVLVTIVVVDTVYRQIFATLPLLLRDAGSSAVAYGVLRACRELGLRVPEDLALVGFDDEPPSRYLDPPLASVEQPLHELGYEAALLLLECISGEIRQPAEKVLPARLIYRASLGDTPRVDPTLTPLKREEESASWIRD